MANQVAKFEIDDGTTLEVDLKDPRLAGFLAWLVPGLGHIYQGRTGKGILFFVCIVGTFIYGMYIGGGHVVYASTPNLLARWQYLCQLGVGLPALPALVQRMEIEPLQSMLPEDFMRPPSMRGPFESEDKTNRDVRVLSPDELAKWHYDRGDYFDIGTVFTVIAGLLNLLVIYDAYGGPLVIPPPEDDKEPDGGKEKSSKETKS